MTDDLEKWVFPIAGEPLRFHVRSRSNPAHKHLVDLGCYEHKKRPGIFNGQCACEDFAFHLKKLLDAGAFPNDKTRCWHIKQAVKFLAEYTVSKLHQMTTAPAKPAPAGRVVNPDSKHGRLRYVRN